MLLFSVIAQVSAEEQKKIVNQPQKLGSVTMKSNVIAEVNNLILLPTDSGQSVGFTLTVHNNGNTEFDFINYWVNLYSKSGTKYSVNATKKDIAKIPAMSSRDIMFYSQVGANIKASDLIIKVIEWD